MPYTLAVISEILRTDVIRRSLEHTCDKDTVIQGHKIPKGSFTFIYDLPNVIHVQFPSSFIQIYTVVNI